MIFFTYAYIFEIQATSSPTKIKKGRKNHVVYSATMLCPSNCYMMFALVRRRRGRDVDTIEGVNLK